MLKKKNASKLDFHTPRSFLSRDGGTQSLEVWKDCSDTFG